MEKKTCRVCGKEYDACKSARTGSPVFNWREVACSPECGAKYLEQVRKSRKKEEPAREKKLPHQDRAEESAVQETPVLNQEAQEKEQESFPAE